MSVLKPNVLSVEEKAGECLYPKTHFCEEVGVLDCDLPGPGSHTYAGPCHRGKVSLLALIQARWSQQDGLYLEAAAVPPCQVESKSIIRCCLFSGQTGSVRAVGKQALKERVRTRKGLCAAGSWLGGGRAGTWMAAANSEWS